MAITHYETEEEIDDAFERIEELNFEYLSLKEEVEEKRRDLEEAEKELQEFEEEHSDVLL